MAKWFNRRKILRKVDSIASIGGNMVKVINNEIVAHGLPQTGTLLNGSTVSGYDLLDEATLKEEGWLPLVLEQPQYNAETQYITFKEYLIESDKVTQVYEVHDIIVEPVIPYVLEEEKYRDMVDQLFDAYLASFTL